MVKVALSSATDRMGMRSPPMIGSQPKGDGGKYRSATYIAHRIGDGGSP